ncbi:uncharacterized protein K02A2.6-like [Amphibalanus amphitrite]|uniref:uncharacterized protein K02A2.6-like n=1 Tax=Amphibalanus amphitrite TaxID=1232801 RepID=UPI001C929D40|nr:uncharacterized protein K02A2.6-like [Amphibalanus amphitrite]
MLPEVEYLGWKVTAEGISPTDEGTSALLAAPEPQDVQQLRSLLGSVTYFARLLPDLSTVLSPLYHLLKKDSPWKWTKQCSAAVAKVKKLLTNPPVLMRYEPTLPLKLVTDASSVGVGAALMHVLPGGAERPIMYASRTLTPTERKYAQVEREAAAVSYGVSRFHRFLYGRQFTLVVDNRALSRILSPDRNLPTLAAARLQRYALQLAAYSYTVELRRSEQMHVADSLSRLVAQTEGDEQSDDSDSFSGGHLLYMDGVTPALTAQELTTASRRDPMLSKVLTYVRCGWPDNVEAELEPYKRRREELSTDGDTVLWGGRTVVPQRLRARVLGELHEAHLGASKMKNLARRYVWWPGMDAELEGLARDCADCAEKRGAPPRSVLHPWEPTGVPWERIHVDFAGPFQSSYFFIVYDSHTKWIEAVPMREISTESTIRELRAMFARFGIPRQLVSDNGAQFTAMQFAEFTRNNGVRHIRVAPYHPSSNGAAERAVQTVKGGLKAALRGGGTLSARLQKFLLAYRVAPHASTGKSPSEMMLGRSIRTRLDLLRPDPAGRVRDQQQRQEMAAGGANRSFLLGDEVWVRHYGGPSKWKRGTVVARTGPVSYEVKVGEALWSRHVDQMRAAGQGAPADAIVSERPGTAPAPETADSAGQPGPTEQRPVGQPQSPSEVQPTAGRGIGGKMTAGDSAQEVGTQTTEASQRGADDAECQTEPETDTSGADSSRDESDVERDSGGISLSNATDSVLDTGPRRSERVSERQAH